MLPVLGRFNGSPQVDSQGNIVYTFPDLQQTATVSPAAVPDTGGRLLDVMEQVQCTPSPQGAPWQPGASWADPCGCWCASPPLLLLLLSLVCRPPAGRRRCGA